MVKKIKAKLSRLLTFSQPIENDNIDYYVLVGTFLAYYITIILAYKFPADVKSIIYNLMLSSIGLGLLFFSQIVIIAKLSFLIFQTTLYFKYKAIESVADSELPNCTIIVPAYNEGHLVYDTLLNIAQSDYPVEKMEIISIDDGSKDDTWQWIQKAKEEIGDCLTIFQQPINKGKRQALFEGFKIAKGDVFVTVDSDSIVEQNTIRNLVSPFIVNPECGAVAGNIKVLNQHKYLLAKMLNVSFTFSFEFVRSAQSVLGSVLCTPGASAAYRKEAVMNCLDEWVNQTFRGQVADIGEDRAMTNMILKQGYKVLFQKNAKVKTEVPNSLKTLSRMFTRWERSNVRENIMMSKFAFKKFREGKLLGTRILLLNQWLKILLAFPFLLLMFVFFIGNPVFFLLSTLLACFIYSAISFMFYALTKDNFLDSVWAFPYSILYTFTLFWITPYAIMTVGRRGWLTR